MKQLHLTLQGKGGAGKSYITSLIMQYFQRRDLAPVGIDTDPVNATLSSYKALDVKVLNITKNNKVEPRSFDVLIEQVLNADDDAIFVVDNGASTFLPLCAYMFENDVINFLKEQDVTVYIHTVLTGGQALGDTTAGLKKLFEDFPDTKICVWVNGYFGEVGVDGVGFEETALYEENIDNIHCIINLPDITRTTHGEDVKLILEKKQTYEEAIKGGAFTVMAQNRLNKVWGGVEAQLTAAQF